MPHPRLGEEVAAAVVLRPGATVTAAELRVFVGERLAPYKVPRRVVVVDELPEGATGKLERRACRRTFGLGRQPAVDTGVAAEQRHRTGMVATLWQRVLGLDDVARASTPTSSTSAATRCTPTELLVLRSKRRSAGGFTATVFFTGATVRAMAATVRPAERRPATPSTVVPVQPRRARAPAVLPSPRRLGRHVRHFAAALGTDRPVYGL